MSNPFYTYSGSFIPGTLGRAEAVASEFSAVQAGFALLATQGVGSGSANAYVVTTQGAPTAAYADGQSVTFKAPAANTGPSTVNVNAIGVISLLRFSGAALAAGDISLNTWYTITYNSSFSAWCISGPAAVVTTVGTIALGAPTHKVGLTAAGGSSTQVTPIDATYAIDLSIVPTWTGLHNFTGGLQVNGSAVSTSVGANPTASIGLTAVNGTATTWMRSDGAPLLSQAIVPTWTGLHTFAPPAGNSLVINSSNVPTSSSTDILVNRAGSTANVITKGPNIVLFDTTNTTVSALQQSGGQTELWQFNGGWNQIWAVATNRGLAINAPVATTGVICLTVNGGAAVGGYGIQANGAATTGSSFGVLVVAGTNTSDIAFAVQNQANNVNYLRVGGDGSIFTGTNTAQGVGTLNVGGLYVANNPVYSGVPQRLVTTSQTTVLADNGKHIANFTGSLTVTIAANASVAYPIGAAITFVSGVGVTTTIAIASDTLFWAATGGSGSRTLAALGMATALKVNTTAWIISGTGLS